MSKDETWGLSWSRRWHKINPDSRPVGLAVCGAPVHTQAEIRGEGPHGYGPIYHLGVILAEPEKAAGICKKCEKKAAAQ